MSAREPSSTENSLLRFGGQVVTTNYYSSDPQVVLSTIWHIAPPTLLMQKRRMKLG